MRCLERALRRAALPVACTQGFTPRPRAVFTLALALGVEAHSEVLELDLTEPMDPDEVAKRLNTVLPDGFEIHDARVVPAARAAQAASASYRLSIPESRRLSAAHRLSEFLGRSDHVITRVRRDLESQFDLRPSLLDGTMDDAGTLRFRLKVDAAGSARPEELLEVLELRDLLETGSVLVREEVELVADVAPVASRVSIEQFIHTNPEIDAAGVEVRTD
jgi:radical SAM-linked protein